MTLEEARADFKYWQKQIYKAPNRAQRDICAQKCVAAMNKCKLLKKTPTQQLCAVAQLITEENRDE